MFEEFSLPIGLCFAACACIWQIYCERIDEIDADYREKLREYCKEDEV